jgi:precorrin-6B methylase 2
MTVEPVREVVARLGPPAEALAALGAVLRLRMSGAEASPEVEACLDEVMRELGVAGAVAGASPEELNAALSPIRALFLQAIDLLDDPARAPGWGYTDPGLLESLGQTSAGFAALVRDIVAPSLEGLEERLAAGGAAFLDVGVGVAGLAIAMCRLWPDLRAVGIDPWDPALALARRNVAVAGLADRIELRHQVVEELSDVDSFDLAFLPGPFLQRRVLAPAAERVLAALRPGGWVLIGLWGGGEDLVSAVARLRTVRAGGALLGAPEGEELLRGAGFDGVRTLDAAIGLPSLIVAGRRPE